METIEFYRSDTGLDGDWVLMATDYVFFPGDQYRVGLAVTSSRNNYLAEATFEDYEIMEYAFPTAAPSISLAPSSWDKYVDIGNPPRRGEYSISEDQTIQYVKGSGSRIWGTTDQFFFVNEMMTDDGSGSASAELYIKQFDNSNVFARGGIMIRDTNDADSANIFLGAAGADQGVVFQSRPAAGAETTLHKMTYVNGLNQFWVKLDKVGTLYTAYYKLAEGDEWIAVGSTTLVTTGTTVTVGQAVSAGSDYEWALQTMQTTGLQISALEETS
jgi:hypothetical protein